MKNKTKFNIAVALMCIVGIASLYAIYYFHVWIPFLVVCVILVSLIVYCYIRVSECDLNDKD